MSNVAHAKRINGLPLATCNGNCIFPIQVLRMKQSPESSIALTHLHI